MKSVYIPSYLRIVRRTERQWRFTVPKRIVLSRQVEDTDFLVARERQYGLTKGKLVLEFRLLTGGKLGYYLADMKRKLYYYCGESWDDVRAKLSEIGIGRVHPSES